MDPSAASLHESFQSMLNLEGTGKLPSSNNFTSDETSETADAFQGLTTVASAESQYSSILEQQHFDVFVNHRGPDVKEILAIPLYKILSGSHGLQVFVDTEAIQLGELFSAAIQRAIRCASVHIAIFSPHFASSPWCLAELAYILKQRARHNSNLIPVYYNVDPSDLQYVQRGIYAAAFEQHELKGRYPKTLIDEWKAALHQASYYHGMSLQGMDFDGNKDKLIQGIVNAVLQHVQKQPLEVAQYPVGMDSAVEDFENSIASKQMEHQMQGVKIVGIVGMGGSGKTTLAKELFNRKQKFFSRSSFLSEVREMSEKNKICRLQRKLIQDLVKVDELIFSSEEGKTAMRRHLKGLRVLIVLDDISQKGQLDNLLMEDILDSESWILVTSRDKALLKKCQINFVYDIKKLDYEQAEELFCRHAFLQPDPVEKFQHYVEKFVKACDGLPLSLKIVAGQLSGNFTKQQWEIQLQKFSKELDHGIEKVLSFSYNSLEDFERQLFLDVACFFHNEAKELLLRIWDDWRGWLGLQMLENKCLVEFDDNDYIRMHDHLRDFGRMMAGSQYPIRIWHTDNIKHLLAENQFSENINIQGIMAATGPHLGGICASCYKPPFQEIEQLARQNAPANSPIDVKLLVISGTNYFKSTFSKSLTKNLKWLRWYEFPHQSIPKWLSMSNLRVLEILAAYKEHIRELWSSEEETPRQLRQLCIINSRIVALPQSIALMTCLEKLTIEGDLKIKTIPEELCTLVCLRRLELRHCQNLLELPNNIGNLHFLEYLDLLGCKKLRNLPSTVSRLKNLCYLELGACYRVVIPDNSFEGITTLQYLKFHHCRKLRVIAQDITCLADLKTLDLRDTSLAKLPTELWRLKRLEILRLGSKALTDLPSFHKHLTNLKELSVEGCEKLEYLQDSVQNLASLSRITLQNCGLLCIPRGIEELTKLESLHVSFCPITELNIIRTPNSWDVSLHPKRQRLDILQRQPMRFLKLLVLKKTDLLGSISISEEYFPHLEEIDISCNKELQEVLKLPGKVQKLSLEECSKLRNVDGLSDLTKLRTLNVSGCHELQEIPSLHSLTSLEDLDASDCWKLQEIIGIEHLKTLSELVLRNCNELIILPPLENLTALTLLDITNCYKLQHVEGLEKLQSLDSFVAGGCRELQSVQGLKSLNCIRFVELPINKVALNSYIPTVKIFPQRVFIKGKAIPDFSQLLELLTSSEPDASEAVGVSYHGNKQSHWQLIFCPAMIEKTWVNGLILIFVAKGELYVSVFSPCSEVINQFNYDYLPGEEFFVDKSQWSGAVDGVDHWLNIQNAWMILVRDGEETQKWQLLLNTLLPAFADW